MCKGVKNKTHTLTKLSKERGQSIYEKKKPHVFPPCLAGFQMIKVKLKYSVVEGKVNIDMCV